MPDVIVIGAGITGLSCAWRLKRLGVDTMVLESSRRPGGVIESECVGGYLVERGPNTLLPAAANFPLLDEAGLASQIVEADRKAPRFICIDGALRKAPFGVMRAGGLLRTLAEPFIRSHSPEDESIRDFFVRRLGREAEERLVSPFVTGIWAGNTRTLSASATFPTLVEMERKHGSLLIGMMKARKPKQARRGRTSSFAAGMETLPRTLAADCSITYDTQNVGADENLRVTWTGGETQAKAIVITTPSNAAAKIIEGFLPRASDVLRNIQYAPMVVAAAAVPVPAFPKALEGFGFLVPRSEKIHILGTLFNSALFPGRAPAGQHLLTSFVGGALEPEALDWPENRIWDVVRTELRNILKLSQLPEPVKLVHRARAIPQYRIGHERAIAKLQNEIASVRGLFLAGNYIGGVSLAACIDNGERIAQEVAAFVRQT
jgi:oxygen-dependent protoporphyrinogen oxidase